MIVVWTAGHNGRCMSDISLLPLTHTFQKPSSASRYATLHKAYWQESYDFRYSERLIHVPNRDFYALQKLLDGAGEGLRMSTAAEEVALQLELEKADRDPRNARVFDDLFSRNDDQRYYWQWTATALRVPLGRRPEAYEVDKQGRRYWVRMLVSGNEEVGEVLVPEGNGRVVPPKTGVSDVWDEVSGLPTVTEPLIWPHSPYTTHFWF